jgi:hypothetical protein
VLLGGRYKHIAFKTYGGKTKRSYFHIGGQNQKKTFGGTKNLLGEGGLLIRNTYFKGFLKKKIGGAEAPHTYNSLGDSLRMVALGDRLRMVVRDNI